MTTSIKQRYARICNQEIEEAIVDLLSITKHASAETIGLVLCIPARTVRKRLYYLEKFDFVQRLYGLTGTRWKVT